MSVAAFLVLLLAAQSVQPPSGPPAPSTRPAAPTDWPFRGFSVDDYPAAALRAGEEGYVAYRLEIGPNGRVSGCSILRSSGSAALDAGTCRIVSRRSRFTPARDSAGHPVPDHRDGEVTWRLGREDK